MAYAASRDQVVPLPSGGLLDGVNRWCLARMPALNRDILDGQTRSTAFAPEFEVSVLARLPAPESFTAEQAQQLVVILGLAGASVGRHYQEHDPVNRGTPERAFADLTVGADREPFVRYFARLAERTGTGHAPRDSYASLVRWNLPTAEVWRAGQRLASLPSVFSDGLVRSYTGVPDENRFFGLLKASEVLERAVNHELMPLSDGSIELDDGEAIRRIAQAIVLLDALRELNHDFAVRPADQGMGVDHFLDVFRQFAVHWSAGDIPPSGALDAEALIRDLLVGIDLPSYPVHLHRVFPGLLDHERTTLTRLLNRPSLPQTALRLAGIDPAEPVTGSLTQLHQLVVRHPVLASLHLLLNAHARLAGVHLRLSKLFLFGPQRVRDAAGLGDTGVVSNRSGTTGMDQSRLELLTRARHHHLLAPLHVIPSQALEGLAGLNPVRAEPSESREVLVRFTGTSLTSQDLGLSDGADRHERDRAVHRRVGSG